MLPRSEAEYVGSLRDQAMVERYLERMIGRAIDINYHLLTASGEPPPPDDHSSFTRLASLGVLEASFAKRVASAAGLRNRIVHDYDRIDPAKVYKALQDALDDLPSYLRQVRAWLERA